MKLLLRSLFSATLDEIAIERVLAGRIPRDWCEPAPGRSLVVALGKAALSMARVAHEVTGLGGLAVGPGTATIPGFACLRGGHPLPDAGSLAAAAAVLERLDALGGNDRVLFLLSGGGSAMLEQPLHGGLEELVAIHRRLVTSGLDIVATNVVRKHLSAVKGGRLAARAFPARQLTLYVSDVPEAHPDAVASGPTMPDPSTVAQCRAIAGQLGLALPAPLAETPKPGDPVFARSRWRCVLRNADALEAAARYLRARGFSVAVDPVCADRTLDQAVEHLFGRLDTLEPPAAVVSGGELACPVAGDGTGGRNAAFVLRCLPRLAGRRLAVLSAGTDGIDGNSPAAGAVADGDSLSRARKRGLDPAAFESRFDSYTFFAALGDAIETGPTGNNVRDLRVVATVP